MQRFWVVYHGISSELLVFSRYKHQQPSGECLYRENTRDKWYIPWYTTRERCVTIYTMPSKIQHNQCDIRAAHDGKIGCDIVDYIMTQIILAFWLVLAYDLLEDRRTIDVISNRSQMTSKCGKNKNVAHLAIAECVTDVLTSSADLLLNRRTATWNLFVLYYNDSNYYRYSFFIFISP